MGDFRIYAAAPERYRFDLAFIGEDNPHSTDPRYALYHEPSGCAGDRLRRLICQMRVTTYHRIGRANLCAGRWGYDEAAANARKGKGVDHEHPNARP
jgi:hypothetical protein